jgi:hypothetical protein
MSKCPKKYEKIKIVHIFGWVFQLGSFLIFPWPVQNEIQPPQPLENSIKTPMRAWVRRTSLVQDNDDSFTSFPHFLIL